MFSELPLELRLQVWSKAIIPRTVAFVDGCLYGSEDTSILAMLHVSREARKAWLDSDLNKECEQLDTMIFWGGETDVLNFGVGAIRGFGHLAIKEDLWESSTLFYKMMRSSPTLRVISAINR